MAGVPWGGMTTDGTRSSVEAGSGPDTEWNSDTVAGWWQREFTDGVDPEYTEQIIPLAADVLAGRRRVLDIGTGEGQLARVLAAGGADVTGIDIASAQVREATRRGQPCQGAPPAAPRTGAVGPGTGAAGLATGSAAAPQVGRVQYLRAVADGLPFADGSFDGVLACLVFEHIDELDASLAEVARVLAPGGRFAFFLNHPLLQTPDSGWIDDHMVDPPEQYWRIGRYLVESAQDEQVQKGVFIRFVHRPLGRYVNGLVDVGLTLTRMVEPAPPPGFVAKAPEYFEVATIPRLLVLVADKVAGA